MNPTDLLCINYIDFFFIIYPTTEHINNEFLKFLPLKGPLFTNCIVDFLRANISTWRVLPRGARRCHLLITLAESHQNRNVIIIMKEQHPKRLT